MQNNILKTHCNRCSGHRRHEVLHTENTVWHEELDDSFYINGSDDYKLVKCCGCETVSLVHESRMSEDTNDDGSPNITIYRYPAESYRAEPAWISELIWEMGLDNNFIQEYIREIYISLRNNSPRLATMGIRALLEHVMIDKVSDNGTFNKNLNVFENKGFVSKSQRQILEQVLDAGHATIHRLFKPTQTDVGKLMDITESIIESIYINASRARDISRKVPKRASKKLPDS